MDISSGGGDEHFWAAAVVHSNISITDKVFVLRFLTQKYREGQTELGGAFVDLERTYDCGESNVGVVL